MSVRRTSIVELSHKLDLDVQVYPGEAPFSFRPTATIEKDGYNVRSMIVGSHTGTHIDAPFHFSEGGKTIDQLPLSDLIGSVLVVDLSQQNLQPRQKITWESFEPYAAKMQEGVILLVNTGWSQRYWRTPQYIDHPFLSREVAEGILRSGIRVIGIDTLNPDETPFEEAGGDNGWGVHEVILGAGGVIAENMTNLEALAGKDGWEANLIPLNLTGSDGSPIRAFARQFPAE